MLKVAVGWRNAVVLAASGFENELVEALGRVVEVDGGLALAKAVAAAGQGAHSAGVQKYAVEWEWELVGVHGFELEHWHGA